MSLPAADPALYRAVWTGNTGTVRTLVGAGANVNSATPDGDPLLREAVWRGHTEIVRILVGAGANVDARDSDGDPLLREAIWRDEPEIVRILVGAGANVDAKDSDGDPILFEAVWRGHTEIVRILVGAGVDVTAVNSDGDTPLYEATWRDHTEIVRILTAALSSPQNEVAKRDELIASQEALLNVYRCMFNVDTQIVPGGCSNGKPVLPAAEPASFTGTPTADEVAKRDELIASQEALLNVYRCMFNVDTQIVPGGC